MDNPSTVRTIGSCAAASTTVARAGGPSLSSTAANGTYSFGSGTSTAATVGGSDRAVGFLSSGTATASGNLYAQYVNNSGADLTGLRISYDDRSFDVAKAPAVITVAGFNGTYDVNRMGRPERRRV